MPTYFRGARIDPRPYYSKRIAKRVLEKLENFTRGLMRKYLNITRNFEYRISITDTKINLSRIANFYADKKIIFVASAPTNNFLFPGAKTAYIQIDEQLKMLALKHKGLYFDFKPTLDAKSDVMNDCFHLKQKGHLKIALEFKTLLWSLYNE